MEFFGLKHTRKFLTFCLSAIFLSGCLPNSNSGEAQFDIVTITLKDGKEFYIPRAYFAPGAVGTQNIHVTAMQPDFSPMTETPSELFEKGKWFQNVTILGRSAESAANLEKFVAMRISSLAADNIVGDQYGLTHRSQKEPSKSHLSDIWLEKNEDGILSIITCGEIKTANTKPQCTHFYYRDNILIEANFDKRLLKDWKQIKHQTAQMLTSFRAKETSAEYINAKLKPDKESEK